MASLDILAEAARIASVLQALPDIDVCYDYARPVSNMENGEACIAISGSSPPDTYGPHGTQTVVWYLAVRLGSSLTDADGGAELQKKLSRLLSGSAAEGVIGVLRSGSPHGARVTDDGLEVEYDEEQDQSIITFVTGQITRNLRAG